MRTTTPNFVLNHINRRVIVTSNRMKQLKSASDLIKPAEAARLVGVSYPTMKQWIYSGKVRSTRTLGGHHRIARSEVERVSGIAGSPSAGRKPVGLDAISGRNKLKGTISDVRYEGLLVQVTIEIAGQTITSIITSDAARALELSEGVSVYALIKATEVMVIRD
jgi:molybdopterin-binding protein